jgi:osmoprotectant transport system substrate-binding protein
MDRRKTLATLATALATSCQRTRHPKVGSKNFTEQVILGEIIAQYLESKTALLVDRKLDLGGTLLAHQALLNSAIDLYPEYTGTALTAVLNMPPAKDPRTVWETVNVQYQERFGLLWLHPLGFENTFAMAVSSEIAKRENLRTLSDAAGYAKGWRLGVGYEFLDRPDGLPALKKTYNLPLAGAPRTMDLGLLYQALRQGQVDLIAANSTDGLLTSEEFTVLDDDRRAFPPYQAAIVARVDSLATIHHLRHTLEQLSGKIPEAAMRRLNHAVDVEKQTPAAAAAQFLKTL